MDIYIGADYKGLEKKNELVKFLFMVLPLV